MGIERYYTTAGSNTDVDGINIAEGMAPNLVNNAMRQMVANVRKWFNDAEWVQYGSGDGPPDISYVSATSFTVNGVDVTDEYHAGRRVKAVGSSTGTIYGTIQSSDFVTNTTVTVEWDSGQLENEALEIYLAILRAENVSLPNSDAARATLGLGSMATQNANNVNITGGSATFTGGVTLLSDDDTNAGGPTLKLYRDSESPAASDALGLLPFSGNNDAGEEVVYGRVRAVLDDPTDGSEDGHLELQAMVGGSLSNIANVGSGIVMQGATGGYPGAGKINATGYQINGAEVFPVGATNLATTTAERDWVLARIASSAHGAVGTYIMAALTESGNVDPGADVAASSLDYSNAAGNNTSSATLSGTWECRGRALGAGDVTLWIRVV